jgi:hypothetical protein
MGPEVTACAKWPPWAGYHPVKANVAILVTNAFATIAIVRSVAEAGRGSVVTKKLWLRVFAATVTVDGTLAFGSGTVLPG